MNLQGTEFIPAHKRTECRERYVIFDFHGTASARRQLREAAIQFVQKLFRYAPLDAAEGMRNRVTVLIICGAGVGSGGVGVVTESGAIGDLRNLGGALKRLKWGWGSSGEIEDGEVERFVGGIAEEVGRWVGGGEGWIVVGCERVLEGMKGVFGEKVFYGREVRWALDEMVGRVHERGVWMDIGGRKIELVWRPRVLMERGKRVVKGLKVVKGVKVDGVVEDIVGGVPRVIWEESESGGTFWELMKRVRDMGVGLICAGEGRAFVVIGSERGVGLVKEVGFEANLLPVREIRGEGNGSWEWDKVMKEICVEEEFDGMVTVEAEGKRVTFEGI